MAKTSPTPKYQRPTECRVCGRSDVRISRRGLCEDDAIRRQTFAAIELHAKQGPSWDAWKVGMRRASERA